MTFTYFMNDEQVTLINLTNGNRVTIHVGDSRFPEFSKLVAAGKYDEAEGMDVKSIVTRFSDAFHAKSGNFMVTIDDGVGNVVVSGTKYPLASAVVQKIIKMSEQGFDPMPLVNFLENLYRNPSKVAIAELFLFLDAAELPITPDGHFLAYKRVREDYLDCHSGTMDNSVGNVLEMDRNAVDDDKNRTCSAGLHFCSFDYLKSFHGERIVIVKINPKDVVAIPADYNNSKGRTCRYEVVGESELDGYKLPHKKLDEGFTLDFWYNEAQVQEDEQSLNEIEEDTVQDKKENFNGILKEYEVLAIRSMFGARSLNQIADYFAVSPRTIARIRDGLTYTHVK